MLNSLYQQLRTWFYQAQDAILSRPALKRQIDQSALERDREELPFSIERSLRRKIESLPPPEDEINQILQAFARSLTDWQTNPSVINHTFVLLRPPSFDNYPDLWEKLFERVKQAKLPFYKLNWTQRPTPISELTKKLRNQIGGAFVVQSPEVLAVPNLSLCFLRHAEGLDGIDFICERMLGDKHRFWIIDVNTICWDYLSAVTALDACCCRPLRPYHLSGEQLQSWLAPLLSEFSIEFSRNVLQLSQSKDDQIDLQQQYFETLAQLSDGNRIVAIEIFLRSLECQTQDNERESQESEGIHLQARYPVLPSLPSLDSEDLCLLYSLFLHDKLSLEALEHSLGSHFIQIQPRLQKLRISNVIYCDDNCYQVNAIHYPRLKQSLISNNFMIHQEFS